MCRVLQPVRSGCDGGNLPPARDECQNAPPTGQEPAMTDRKGGTSGHPESPQVIPAGSRSMPAFPGTWWSRNRSQYTTETPPRNLFCTEAPSPSSLLKLVWRGPISLNDSERRPNCGAWSYGRARGITQHRGEPARSPRGGYEQAVPGLGVHLYGRQRWRARGAYERQRRATVGGNCIGWDGEAAGQWQRKSAEVKPDNRTAVSARPRPANVVPVMSADASPIPDGYVNAIGFFPAIEVDAVQRPQAGCRSLRSVVIPVRRRVDEIVNFKVHVNNAAICVIELNCVECWRGRGPVCAENVAIEQPAIHIHEPRIAFLAPG